VSSQIKYTVAFSVLLGFGISAYMAHAASQQKISASPVITVQKYQVDSPAKTSQSVLGSEATPSPIPQKTSQTGAVKSKPSPAAYSTPQNIATLAPAPTSKFVPQLIADPMGWLITTSYGPSPIPLYESNSFSGQYFMCSSGRYFYGTHLVDGVAYPADPGYPDCNAIFVQPSGTN
jgi:hypothetical protein